MMKRIAILIATLLAVVFCSISFVGCDFVDVLDGAIELESIREQNEQLREENQQLKEELATLKFQIEFPDGIVDEDIILNNVVRKVGNTDGDAIQVVGNSTVVINGGEFDGGNTPLGGLGNTSVWCNSVDAKVIINGGLFSIGGLADGDTGHVDLIYCSAGTIEINGGTFIGEDATVWLVNCKDSSYADGTAKIVIKGGTFVDFNPADCVSEGEHTNFVADGYKVITEVVNEGSSDEYTLYTVVEGVEEPEVPGEF